VIKRKSLNTFLYWIIGWKSPIWNRN